MVMRLIAVSAMSLWLAGCESLPTPAKNIDDLDATLVPILQAGVDGQVVDTRPVVSGGDRAPPPPRQQLYPGTGQVVGVPPQASPDQPIFAEGADGVTLNFNDTPLPAVVQTILGDLLGENYSIEPGLEGSVTMATSRPIRRDSLVRVLESILDVHGAGLTRTAGGTYRVGPRPLLRGVAGVSRGPATTPGYGIRIVPLSFVGTEEMAKIIGSVAAEDAVLLADSRRNLLVVGGTSAQLASILQLIDTFDVDVLKGMSVGIYPVSNLSADDMATVLDQILGADGEAPLSGRFRIVPLSYANRVVVLTSQSRYLKEIGNWIARLDFDDGTETKLYIYPVQNGDAEYLAEKLANLFGMGGARRGPAPRGEVVPGSLSATLTSGGGGDSGGGSASRALSSPGSSGFGGGGSGATLSGVSLENVSVEADAKNNTLLIMADATSYRVIENALRRLDIQPEQVLIETNIVEVSLSDQLEYGLEWFFDSKIDGYTNTFSSQNDASPGLAAKAPGFSWTISDSAGIIKAVFNALAQESLLRVISSPSLLVLDNHTANIKVGDQQPVSVGQSTNTNTGTVITESIEYKDTGVSLDVTPRVNQSGFIVLEISQDVTDIGEIDAATGQRSFLQRSLQSTVAVQSGQTIVLGGLIRDNVSTGSGGVPFLHRVPGIGWMFGAKQETGRRTELLITLTPRVLRSTAETAALSGELVDRMDRVIKDMTYKAYGSTLIRRPGP